MRRRRPQEESAREEVPARVDEGPPAAWVAAVGRPATELPARLGRADAGTRAAVVGRLQQGSGNARVCRMLARRATEELAAAGTEGLSHRVENPEWTPAVEPHGDGADSDTQEAVGQAAVSEEESSLAGFLQGMVDMVESAAESAEGASPDPWSRGATATAAPAVAGPIEIGHSVGAGGRNAADDVRTVGDRLSALGFLDGGSEDVAAVTAAIRRYQADALGWHRQDARVDPGGKTLRALSVGQKEPPPRDDPRAAPPPEPEPEAETARAEPAPPTARTESAETAPAQPTGGGGTPAPRAPVDATIEAWARQQPRTNPEYASWILEGARHGFVILQNNTKAHLETFSRGGKIEMNSSRELGGTVDGSADVKVLGTLEIVRSMVLGRATRWLADPSKGKQPFTALSLARNLKGPIKDAHRTGAALDAGGFDWTGSNGPRQVVQVLQDLPPGKYNLGLPYQGQFFSVFDSVLHFENKAAKAAKESGGEPADVTQPGLDEWTTARWTSKWNAAKGAWDRKIVDYNVRGMIKDAELRQKLAGFDGKTFGLFPDRPSHIHIQRA